MADVKKSAFMLSSATVMMAPAFNVPSVFDLNPADHSVGMVAEVSVITDSSIQSLQNGVAQSTVDSKKTGISTTLTGQVFEMTAANFLRAQGIAKTPVQMRRLQLATNATAGAVSIDAIVDAVPGEPLSTVNSIADIPAGSTLLIQRHNQSDYVLPIKTTGPAIYNAGVYTIPIAGGIPANMGFFAQSKVWLVEEVPIANIDKDDFFCVKIAGILTNFNRPVVYIAPKVKLSKGFQLSFSATQYTSMNWEMIAQVMSLREATGRLTEIGNRQTGVVYSGSGSDVPPAPILPVNTTAPALSGTAQEGQVLSSSDGVWTGSPTGFTYQWNRSGTPIAGSINSTRTVTSADIGFTLSCTVTATNANGSALATSPESATVSAAPVPVPVNSVAPVISGTQSVGSTLSTTNGTWSGSPTSYAYAWRREGVDISGATGQTYVLVSADAGKNITCRVYATNAGGTAGATSNSLLIAVPAPANTVAPAVTGSNTVGSVLTTDNGTWNYSPTGYTYQWRRGGVDIAGATSSSYTLVNADSATSVLCRVTATNATGNTAANSNAIAVAQLAPVNTVAPVVTGTPRVGSTLTSNAGTWSYSPTSYAYQWLQDGTPISGATASTYVVAVGNDGHALSCTVTATNSGGSTSANSNSVNATAAPPVNTVAPAVTGSTAIGSVLSTTTGTWSNSPTSYAYQWVRDGTDISGANASTYTTVEADSTAAMTCRVTATNSGGSISAVSNSLTMDASLTTKRINTLSKLRRVITAAQGASNPRDVAPLGLTPTSSLTPTLTNETTYTANPEKFEVLGGAPMVTSDANMWVIADADDAPNTGGGMTTFMPSSRAIWQYAGTWNVAVSNTRYIEIVTRENATLRIMVNGQLAVAGRASTNVNAGTGTNYTLFDLGAVGNYEIGIQAHYTTRFKGIRVDSGGSVAKPTRSDTVTALYLGDSYTSGVANNSVRSDSLMNNVSQYLGFKNSITAAVSGAALQTSTGVKLIPTFYTDFVKPTLGPVMDPDIIVIAAGYNDNGSQSPTIAAAYSFWQQVRADYPRAFIVVMGMWGGVIQTRATLQNREDGLRTQFTTWNDPFSTFIKSVYSIGSSAYYAWQYGTGYVGTPAKDGINDYILYSDRNHPTDGYDQLNGNWYMSTKIREGIIAAFNAMGTTYNPTQAQLTPWPLTIKLANGTTPPAATVGTSYLLATMATGGSTVSKTFSISAGTLPAGLTLQASAGHLTGTPTTAGTYNFTIRATSGSATADLAVTLTVS